MASTDYGFGKLILILLTSFAATSLVLPASPALAAGGPDFPTGKTATLVAAPAVHGAGAGASIGAAAPVGAAAPRAGNCRGTKIRLPLSGALLRTAARVKARLPLTVLAIGSSSTEGIGATSKAMAYPARLEDELERRFPGLPVTVVNAGIGGETADKTIVRLERELAGAVPDLVVWQVGTNDALSTAISEDTFQEVVERGLEAIRKAGSDTLIVDQQFFPKARDPERYERFVAVLEKVSAKGKVCLFPRYRVMKDWGAAGAEGIDTMLSADGFHMNDRGYACVADLLADQIEGIVTAVR